MLGIRMEYVGDLEGFVCIPFNQSSEGITFIGTCSDAKRAVSLVSENNDVKIASLVEEDKLWIK